MRLKLNVIAAAMLSAGMFATYPAMAADAPAHGAAPAATPQAAASPGQDIAPGSSTAKTKAADKQKTDKQKESKDEKLVKTLESIEVVGFSRSIETSIAYQRYSDKIENVVTAADIGGLPDQSIADALTRLPGVAAERISGQASQINLRGLTGNFLATTLNGRLQPSSSGSNYVQFSDYPSELIQQVAIYKSSQADVLEGGVGGTIAMQTVDPLQNQQQHTFNANLRGSYNSRADEVHGADTNGYRVSGAYQGKFLGDTLGVGLGFAEMYQPHVAEQFVNESYSNTPLNLGGKQVYANTGIQVNQVGGTERRRGHMATVVWQPSDHFKLTG